MYQWYSIQEASSKQKTRNEEDPGTIHAGYELVDDVDEVTRTTQIMMRLNPKCTQTYLTAYQATEFIPIIHVKQR